VVQIVTMPAIEQGVAAPRAGLLYALCDDGTMWKGEWSWGEVEWERIASPPQEDA
jgi:hypothetical protein